MHRGPSCRTLGVRSGVLIPYHPGWDPPEGTLEIRFSSAQVWRAPGIAHDEASSIRCTWDGSSQIDEPAGDPLAAGLTCDRPVRLATTPYVVRGLAFGWTPVDVAIEVFRDGALLRKGFIRPDYGWSEPNGPGCGWRATSDLSSPGVVTWIEP